MLQTCRRPLHTEGTWETSNLSGTHLLGKLARGRKHNDTRQAPVLLALRAAVVGQQPLHDGQHESQRLALARPEHKH